MSTVKNLYMLTENHTAVPQTSFITTPTVKQHLCELLIELGSGTAHIGDTVRKGNHSYFVVMHDKDTNRAVVKCQVVKVNGRGKNKTESAVLKDQKYPLIIIGFVTI